MGGTLGQHEGIPKDLPRGRCEGQTWKSRCELRHREEGLEGVGLMALKVDKDLGCMGRVKELEKGTRPQGSPSQL